MQRRERDEQHQRHVLDRRRAALIAHQRRHVSGALHGVCPAGPAHRVRARCSVCTPRARDVQAARACAGSRVEVCGPHGAGPSDVKPPRGWNEAGLRTSVEPVGRTRGSSQLEGLPPELAASVRSARRTLNRWIAGDSALLGVVCGVGVACIALGTCLAAGVGVGVCAVVAGAVGMCVAVGVAVWAWRRRSRSALDAALALDARAREQGPRRERGGVRGARRARDAVREAADSGRGELRRPSLRGAPAFAAGGDVATRGPRVRGRGRADAAAAARRAARRALADARVGARAGRPLGRRDRRAGAGASARARGRARAAARRGDQRARARAERAAGSRARRADARPRGGGRDDRARARGGGGAGRGESEPRDGQPQPQGTQAGASGARDAAAPTSVEGAPPANASARLLETWQRAQAALRAWQESARAPGTSAAESERLRREAQALQRSALAMAAQERAWQPDAERSLMARRDALASHARTSEERAQALSQAVERLERALERLTGAMATRACRAARSGGARAGVAADRAADAAHRA